MKMPVQNFFYGLSLLAILGVPACTTMNTVERAQLEGQRQMVDDKRIVTDAGLNRRFTIVGVNEAMTPGGLLKVQVELLNRTRSYQNCNYRFEWFDANGMQVNGVASALVPLQIEGKESRMISGVAPNPSCKDFRLKLIQ